MKTRFNGVSMMDGWSRLFTEHFLSAEIPTSLDTTTYKTGGTITMEPGTGKGSIVMSSGTASNGECKIASKIKIRPSLWRYVWVRFIGLQASTGDLAVGITRFGIEVPSTNFYITLRNQTSTQFSLLTRNSTDTGGGLKNLTDTSILTAKHDYELLFNKKWVNVFIDGSPAKLGYNDFNDGLMMVTAGIQNKDGITNSTLKVDAIEVWVKE